MGRLLLISILLLLSVFCQGQKPPKQTIIFKDGSRVSGVILSDSMDIVRLKVDNPLVISFNKNQLMSIENNPIALTPITKSSGYYIHLSTSILAGNNEMGNSIDVSLHLSNGFQLGNGLNLGFGSGVEHLGVPIVPLYADINYHPFNSRISPYIYLKTGYGFGFQEEENLYYDGFPIKDTKGGYMLNAGAGVALYSWQNTAITVSVGYRFQKVTISRYNYWWGGTSVTDYITEFNRFELQLGFIFK
jgi:hypothetical protein